VNELPTPPKSWNTDEPIETEVAVGTSNSVALPGDGKVLLKVKLKVEQKPQSDLDYAG
jgi:hypothetical protein